MPEKNENAAGANAPEESAAPGGASPAGAEQPGANADDSGALAGAAGVWARTMLALTGRELSAYFKTTLGYLIMFFFYLTAGVIFWINFKMLNHEAAPPSEFPMFGWFSGVLFFSLTVIIPAVTMRLFSEEAKAGTLETLVTAPVTDLQIVLSKYFAALAYYVILLAPTFLYAFVLVNTSQAHAPDRGPMISGYLGLFFLGAYFLALGAFASACTKNQIVAFIGAFMSILVLHLVFIIRNALSDELWKGRLKPFDFFENFMDFGRGVVDTRHIVYYLAATAVLLFFTVGALESRKWRS